MANTVIQLRKSSTPSAIPTSLEFGELAINYADGKLYYKNTNSQIAEISAEVNYFGTVNANNVLVIADTPGDILTLEAGDNITIVGDAINDKITISAVVPTTDISPPFTQANTARTHANAAFEQANSALTVGQNAFDKANAANVLAFNTGAGANAYAVTVGAAGNAYARTVGTAGNTYTAAAFTQANTSRNHANVSYSQANTARDHANAAFEKANTSSGGAYFQGNNGDVGQASGLGDIFRVHTNILTANVTIYSGNNALAAGPIEIQAGKSLTIQANARVAIV